MRKVIAGVAVLAISAFGACGGDSDAETVKPNEANLAAEAVDPDIERQIREHKAEMAKRAARDAAAIAAQQAAHQKLIAAGKVEEAADLARQMAQHKAYIEAKRLADEAELERLRGLQHPPEAP